MSSPNEGGTYAALCTAIQRAQALETDIVLATNTGASVYAACDVAKELGFRGRIVAVTHVYGMHTPGDNELPMAVRQELSQKGVLWVTAAHALSGAERGISAKFGGVYPVELVAHALRMLGQGVKVCVEISMMALDAGQIPHGKPIVALGGTGRGLDTACVITPGYTACLFDTRVHEVLCKADLYASH